jgi:dihydroneopterin aldolase
MSTYTYEEVLNRAQRLTPDEQLRLIEELAAIIRRQVTARPKHSVTEFRGIAKKFWEGVDVEKFIDEERNSWE